MKYEVKDIDKKRGIVRFTFPGERWYRIDELGKYMPSVTWITKYYPKGKGYEMWLMNHTQDQVDTILKETGGRGSQVHKAIETLLQGQEITPKTVFTDEDSHAPRELEGEEYLAVHSFKTFMTDSGATSLMTEMTVANFEVGYAGTLDWVCEIDGNIWLIDFKTSKDIWPSHKLQVSALKHALEEKKKNHPYIKIDKLGILQVGYARNKNKYKLTEVADDFDMFLNIHKIWQVEEPDREPKYIELPTSIKL